jgi:chitin disaccharide deacetylase
VQKNFANGILGYGDDARLLIVNADDLGMSKSVNDAIFRAIREGVVRSTSLMVPGPEAREAMRRLRDDPVLLSYAPLQEVWAAHGNLA